MNPIAAAQAAGWMFWFDDIWLCTDWEAILENEAPPFWRGNAHDLCHAQGIPHE